MIYSTMTLANALLSLIEFFHDDKNEYVLNAFKGNSESGYTIISNRTSRSASFAQSASGDDIVVYCCDRWDLTKLLMGDGDELDNIAMFFNCDNLNGAMEHILDYLND